MKIVQEANMNVIPAIKFLTPKVLDILIDILILKFPVGSSVALLSKVTGFELDTREWST